MLIVSYDSEILGSGEFWRGPESDLDQIRNIPARALAKKVAADGVERRDGMWTVRKTTKK